MLKAIYYRSHRGSFSIEKRQCQLVVLKTPPDVEKTILFENELVILSLG